MVRSRRRWRRVVDVGGVPVGFGRGHVKVRASEGVSVVGSDGDEVVIVES